MAASGPSAEACGGPFQLSVSITSGWDNAPSFLCKVLPHMTLRKVAHSIAQRCSRSEQDIQLFLAQPPGQPDAEPLPDHLSLKDAGITPTSKITCAIMDKVRPSAQLPCCPQPPNSALSTGYAMRWTHLRTQAKRIAIRFLELDKDSVKEYQQAVDVPLAAIIKQYLGDIGEGAAHVQLLVAGKEVKGSDTPAGLKMSEQDVIVCNPFMVSITSAASQHQHRSTTASQPAEARHHLVRIVHHIQ